MKHPSSAAYTPDGIAAAAPVGVADIAMSAMEYPRVGADIRIDRRRPIPPLFKL